MPKNRRIQSSMVFTKHLLVFFAVLFSVSDCLADGFACGKDKELGYDQAEVGIAETDGAIRIYMFGKEIFNKSKNSFLSASYGSGFIKAGIFLPEMSTEMQFTLRKQERDIALRLLSPTGSPLFDMKILPCEVKTFE